VNFVRYPGRAPVLSGFSFAHSEADHRVETLGVLHTVPDAPKGRSTLTMSLIDDSGTGSEPPYFWTADLVDVAAEGAQGTIQRKEGSCTGSCERALSIRPNEVFLLSGFSFKFRGDDHDIKTIAIAERGGTLSVEFKDKNGDDPFDWSVQYVLVNKARAASVAGRGGTVNSGGVAQSTIDAVPHAKPVLSGFRVEYLEGDHQVREFGVGVTDGRLAVKLADKNGDDRFKWSVNWVSLLR
jgi:hypothetical protein